MLEIQVINSGSFLRLRLWAPLDPSIYENAEAWMVADTLFRASKESWKAAFGRARAAARKKLKK